MLQILHTVEEVIELCLCQSYVPAFHFVFGYQGADAQRFKSIMRGGHLKPATEAGNESMFIYDVLAGDDQFVFLAPVRTPMGMGGGSQYGFIFDADELLSRGAVYGKSDLLSSYEKAAYSVFERHYLPQTAHEATLLGRQRNRPREREEFLAFQPRWGHHDDPVAVSSLLPELVSALQDVQAKRFAGDAARSALSEWAQRICAASQQLVAEARKNVSMHDEKFLRHYEGYASYSDWSEHKQCYVAARDSVAGSRLYTSTVVTSNPEILWPGRLPIGIARAAFMLPEGEHISWPDDIFRLACHPKLRLN